MANGHVNGVLTQVRKLVAAENACQLSDRQLLVRFVRDRDEVAFTALVSRHAAMVLNVCRRVLQNHADAEDACQATFLVLARRASSIRKKDSVGSWLHGVAFRAANNLRREIAHRLKREKRANAAKTDPANRITWREVQTVLDEELQRLPEELRAPVLLCCLEGKAHNEGAQQLGWSLTTFRGRLERARELLRKRLTRRGVVLSGALLAAFLSGTTASAALSPTFVIRTVKAALAEDGVASAAVSAKALSLARGVMDIMFRKKTTVAGLAFLAAATVIGIAGLSVQAVGNHPRQTGAAQEALAVRADAPDAPAAPPAAQPGRGVEVAQDCEVSGRVFGPDDKPLPGAELFVVTRGAKKEDLKVKATSGDDGGFRLRVSRAEMERDARLLATAAGHGPDWVLCQPGQGWPDKVTLRLVNDELPIAGRLLDLEGRPLAGIAVQVVSVEKPTKDGDLKPWINYAQWLARGYREDNLQTNPSAPGYFRGLTSISPAALGLPAVVKTGKDGTFRLTGFGQERVVSLAIREENLEYADLTVVTTTLNLGKEPLAARSAGPRRVYGPRFRYSAGPSRPIVGTVRDKRTGEGIPGVLVQCNSYHDSDWIDQKGGEPLLRWVACDAQATTNDKGEYRIVGLGKHDAYGISVGSVPYFGRHEAVKDAPGLEPLKADFKLEKGAAVRGRLTEEVTGKPVRSRVRYEPLRTNPSLKDQGLKDAFVHVGAEVDTQADGSFALAVLPGPGLLFVRAEAHDQYCHARVDEELQRDIAAFHPKNTIRPEFSWHAVVRINPSEKDAKSGVCDIALEPGETRTGTVVGPDGKPLKGVFVEGHRPVYRATQTLQTDRFTVTGLSSRTPQPVLFYHPEKRLSKLEWVKADKGRPLTVRLEPPGTITGRVVDTRGRPVAGLDIGARVTRDVLWDMGMPQSGFLFQNTGATKTDSEGKFRLEGFIPGLKHTLHGYGKVLGEGSLVPLATDLSVKSGEVKDLGELGDLEIKETPKKDTEKEKK
jgi:RNA polymerase sigma factor (sigma-70 family)